MDIEKDVLNLVCGLVHLILFVLQNIIVFYICENIHLYDNF